MKKNLCLIMLCLLVFNAFGQDKEKCKEIRITEKEGKTYFFTPSTEKVSLVKFVTKGDTLYFLKLRTTGSILTENAKGLMLLMNDSHSISDDEAEIEVKANDDNEYDGKPYIYSAMMKIKPIDMVYLSLYRTIGFKLYIFEEPLTKIEAEKFQQYALCLF